MVAPPKLVKWGGSVPMEWIFDYYIPLKTANNRARRRFRKAFGNFEKCLEGHGTFGKRLGGIFILQARALIAARLIN
jgi:hypothetical protein